MSAQAAKSKRRLSAQKAERATTQTRLFRSAIGFTLIELIAVMLLLAAVLALSAPRLANFASGQNLNHESRRLLALTRFVRAQAISSGQRLDLWFSPGESAYGLQPNSSSAANQAFQYQTADKLDFDIEPAWLDEQGIAHAVFWPDGTIDESSLDRLVIYENGVPRRVIALAENRMEYLIEEYRDADR